VLSDVTRDGDSAATNLITGTITKYLLLGLSIGSGIFLMPFTVRHLGQAEYGLWMLIVSMTSYFQLLDMGYGNGIVRQIVAADRRHDIDGMNRIVSTFVCVYAAIGLAACLVTFAMIVWAVPAFPHLSTADVRTAQALLAILGVRVAVGFPMTVFGAVTNARQGFAMNNAVACLTLALNAAVTYAVLQGGHGLLVLVGSTTLVNLLAYIGYASIARHMFPELRIRTGSFSRAHWRDVTTFSVYLFVIQLAGQISFNVDNVVVGAFLGTTAVAVYTVALRLGEYQRRLCDQFSGMLFPVVMGFGAEGNVEALRDTLIEGTRIAVTLVVGASVCLIGFSRPLIHHWMGASFDGSVAPFIALALAGMIIVSQAAAGNVLLALGSHRRLAGIWLAEAAVNLGLSVVLVRPLGLLGVAVGTLVPVALGHLLMMFPHACHAVALPVRTALRETLRPALAGGSAASVVCVLLRLMSPPLSTRAVMLEAAVTGTIYCLAAYTFGFSGGVRDAYARQAMTVVRRTRRRIVFGRAFGVEL
jgi:O-antigen/teichoic acid export membrane protein